MNAKDPTSEPHVYAEKTFVAIQKTTSVTESLLGQCNTNKNFTCQHLFRVCLHYTHMLISFLFLIHASIIQYILSPPSTTPNSPLIEIHCSSIPTQKRAGLQGILTEHRIRRHNKTRYKRSRHN